MAAPLQIGLFGTFQLSAGTTAITTVNTFRLQALLAYLVLHRSSPQSRQQLAFLFWPDSTDAQARTNLRTLLHRLRSALPDADAFLTIDTQHVGWRAGAACRVDVTDFELELAAAHSAEQAGDSAAARAALERAATIYQGDLLPDCYDEWVLPERERLQLRALTTLDRLVEQFESDRQYSAAIDYGRQLLRLDPLRESTYLSLMRLYAAQGDRPGALRVYHACATVLQHELAAEPNAAIRTAYDRLLSPKEPPPGPAPVLNAGVPLVGRGPQWARAQAAWQAAASGRPRMLVLAGEAGIGKTRLAEELCTWTGRQGAATAVAHCYAAEGDLPYAPVVEWLGSATVRPRLARLDAIWLGEVGRLLPALLVARPDLPRLGPLTESWQRRRLFEALARAVLVDDRPLLLLIDDLQWCDHDTLEWLHFLLHYQPHARLLIVGTVRTEETAADHPLLVLLDQVRHSNQLTEIALAPLSQAETGALAEQLSGGRELPAGALVALYAETEGNPLFVVEMVRAGLVPAAALVRDMEHAAPGEQARGALAGLPPGVQAVITHRLNQIAPAGREVLRLAAVIGRSFTLSVLARAAEGDEDALVRGMDDLWQRRIVREHGTAAYDFSHDKLRVVAYAELSGARRRILHRRVAAAIEAEFSPDLDAVSGQIAAHYEQADQVERAVAYYRRAADVAQRVYAHAEAIGHLRRAVALLARAACGQSQVWQATAEQLDDRLGDLLHLTGQYEEARDAYQSALRYVSADDRLTCAHLLCKIGNAWRDQYHYDEAFASYATAESTLRVAADETAPAIWQAWAQIQLERVQVHYWLAQATEMFGLVDLTWPIVERYGSLLQQAFMHQRRSFAVLRRDRYVPSDEAVALGRAHLKALEELQDSAMLPQAQFQLGFVLLFHNELDAADEQLGEALALAERTGNVSLEPRCVTYLAILNRKRGQLGAVRVYAERSLQVATAGHMPDYVGAANANLAWLAWRGGNLAEARTLGQRALEAWRQTSNSFPFKWTALWPLIGVALSESQPGTAAEYARDLLDPRQQRPPEALEAALQATVSGAARGDLEAARASLVGVLGLARTLAYL